MMVKQIRFEGKVHQFPDDATDDEINQILGGSIPISPSADDRYQNLQENHPYFTKLAGMIANHPRINKAIESAAPYAEHFNRAVQGTGLPNLSRAFFDTGTETARGLASLVPTGVAPKVNIPDPEFGSMYIPEVNPKIQHIGDFLGKLLGYAPEIAASVPITKAALNSAGKLTSEGIAQKLLSDRTAIKKLYSKEYGNLFKEASNAGIDIVKKPKINVKLIEKSGMPKYAEALKTFMDNPTLENAHHAQSSLGSLGRKLDKVAESQQGLLPHQSKALTEARKAQDAIKNAMFSDRSLGSSPHLYKKYHEISSGYAKDVVPWNSAKGLNDFRSGELKAKDLINLLKNNKKFKAQLMDQYPQIKINQSLKSPFAQKALYGLLTGLGLGAGAKAYRDLS